MMHCAHGTRVNHELANLKGIVSAYDNALFLWHDATGYLMGILAMHVDDFVFCGNDLFQENEIAELKKYSKLDHMKVEHLNFGDLVLGKLKMGLLSTKICFIYPQ